MNLFERLSNDMKRCRSHIKVQILISDYKKAVIKCLNSSVTSTSLKMSNVEYGSKCGIEDWNETIDILTKSKRTDHEASSKTEDGRARAHARASNHGNGQYSSEAAASAAALKRGNKEALIAESAASAQVGYGGASADANAGVGYFKMEDEQGRLDLLNAGVGGGVGIGPAGAKAKVEAGVDLVKSTAKFQGGQELSANVGLNVDTGFEAGAGGVSASVAGFGGSIGRTIGVSTPFGGISFKLW